ncbi:QueT transporter family protein [Streptococcus dentasini]
MSKQSTKLIAQNTMIAAIYLVLTLINPISSGIFQFRLSTLLMAVPFFFPRLSYGLVIGVMVSNFFTGFGLIDVFGGFVIQTLSLFVYNKLFKSAYLKSILYGLTAGLVVSSVIFYVTNIPFDTKAFALSVFSVAVSNILIAMIGVFIVDKYLKKLLARFLVK